MPRKLSTKDVLKGTDHKAHPYSRKYHQLKRCYLRDDKLQMKKSVKTGERARITERILWFKFAIPEETKTATKEQILDLIETYLSRNDDDIAHLTSSQIKGRPKDKKQELLEALKRKETKEFVDGVMEIPDLSSAKNVEVLKAYDGDFNSVQRIRMVKVKQASFLAAVDGSDGDRKRKNKKGMDVDVDTSITADDDDNTTNEMTEN